MQRVCLSVLSEVSVECVRIGGGWLLEQRVLGKQIKPARGMGGHNKVLGCVDGE